jgi:hypothetical protein
VSVVPGTEEREHGQPSLETTAVVTALILDRPTCLDCLATKCGLSPTHADRIVQRVASVLKLYRDVARCRMCSAIARVVSVERPADIVARTW